jgi:hypothetical protein
VDFQDNAAVQHLHELLHYSTNTANQKNGLPQAMIHVNAVSELSSVSIFGQRKQKDFSWNVLCVSLYLTEQVEGEQGFYVGFWGPCFEFVRPPTRHPTASVRTKA